jgi:hypothetical protein
MRRAITLVFVLVLSMPVPAMAQEWTEYQNIRDGFKVVFPGQPKVAETTWKSEFDYVLPARVYSAERGLERYSLTVADYSGIEQQGIAHLKTCVPGAETCFGSELSGPGYWRHDVRGALIWATSKFLQRNAVVTRYHWSHQDLVEGHQLQLTNNADQSRTFAFVGMHEMKLYILEGTVPKGYPEPGLFQQSMGWVDKDGNGIRYQTIYANQFYGLKQMPPPSSGGGGRGAGAGPQGQGGGGGRRGGGAGNVQP